MFPHISFLAISIPLFLTLQLAAIYDAKPGKLAKYRERNFSSRILFAAKFNHFEA